MFTEVLGKYKQDKLMYVEKLQTHEFHVSVL